jgi:pantothenate kinase
MEELTYELANSLLKAFDSNINTHCKRIENPKGGEEYYVYDLQFKNKRTKILKYENMKNIETFY